MIVSDSSQFWLSIIVFIPIVSHINAIITMTTGVLSTLIGTETDKVHLLAFFPPWTSVPLLLVFSVYGVGQVEAAGMLAVFHDIQLVSNCGCIALYLSNTCILEATKPITGGHQAY